MSLRRRLQRLEARAPAGADDPDPLTLYRREDLHGMSVHKLLRLHQDSIAWGCRHPPTPAQRQAQRREADRLSRLPDEELRRLHREMMGDLAD
jgi:hypothetical protein